MTSVQLLSVALFLVALSATKTTGQGSGQFQSSSSSSSGQPGGGSFQQSSSSSSSNSGPNVQQSSSSSSSGNGQNQQQVTLNNVPAYANCGNNGATTASQGRPGGPTTVSANGQTFTSSSGGPIIVVGDRCAYQNDQVIENGQSRPATPQESEAVRQYFRKASAAQEEQMKKTFGGNFPFNAGPPAAIPTPDTPPCFCNCCGGSGAQTGGPIGTGSNPTGPTGTGTGSGNGPSSGPGPTEGSGTSGQQPPPSSSGPSPSTGTGGTTGGGPSSPSSSGPGPSPTASSSNGTVYPSGQKRAGPVPQPASN